jgi:hypothetical protein
MNKHLQSVIIVCAVGLMAFLAACNAGGSGTASTSGSTSGTPGADGTATPVPDTCAGLLPGATAATTGGNFADIAFPPNSVTTGPTLQSSGPGLYFVNLQHFCAPTTTVSAVQQFFAAQLPAKGWAQTALFPFNGAYFEACGDPYCWQKDAAPRLVGLTNVQSQAAGNVTFDLQLLRPPAQPSCDPATYPGGYQIFLNSDPNSMLHFELPVLTKIGVSPTTSGNTTTYSLCSSGDQVSIQTEMFDALKRLNWTEAGQSATGFSATHAAPDGSTYQVTVVVNTSQTTNPQDWQLQVQH